ncbi:MAG TPA: N-acetylmuramoyl-L-alanine amidase [Gammaproteobacteria bacterium]|mgnify:CR=1 FL=1|nr:N-acetylmuramoyl-L-alanine amidase [Gammaproteobacteria bacterium]
MLAPHINNPGWSLRFQRYRVAYITAAILLTGQVVLPTGKVSAATSVSNIRVWNAPDHTRVVLDLGGKAVYKSFQLENPLRLVVDLSDSSWTGNLPTAAGEDLFLIGIRSGEPSPGTTRFVLELKQKVSANTFQLGPNDVYGHRLVVDLNGVANKNLDAARSSAIKSPSPTSNPASSDAAYVPPSLIQSSLPVSQNVNSYLGDQILTVAIDAGHGGEDPGARGSRGYREKIITMEIARQLKKVVDADPKMRGVLTRDGDYFINLRKRTEIARDRGAGVFVSIHADAFRSASVSGSSVYALSERGASSEEALWLANQENASDLVGGVSLKDKDQLLAEVLLDLSMTKTISDGREVGAHVLKQLGSIGKVHKKRVETAGFMVLKSPDFPSVLVETGFITNPDEERRLAQKDYQENLANAIYRGLKAYQDGIQPPANVARDSSAGSGSSFLTYTVRRGDTLSGIADRYRVPISKIKQHNRIRNNVVMLDQKLRIPR